jgi:hypothetical protein
MLKDQAHQAGLLDALPNPSSYKEHEGLMGEMKCAGFQPFLYVP